MERRKLDEMVFHNKLRDPALPEAERRYLTTNKKYYATASSSRNYYESALLRYGTGKRVLDYGCGDGTYSLLLARHGAQVVGIDISEVSVSNCERRARELGLEAAAQFAVMDCENLDFQADSFDLVCESGVLHHLDFTKALREIARVVRPDGRVVCHEAVGHNPVFQAYRRATPHLRTEYETEHILKVSDVQKAEDYFENVEMRFFHLLSLAAVPLRSTVLFDPVCRVLDALDNMILRLPVIQRQAWMMIFILSVPKKRCI